jgi:hypothetical protein
VVGNIHELMVRLFTHIGAKRFPNQIVYIINLTRVVAHFGRDSMKTLINGFGTRQRHIVVGHIDFAESRQNGFQQLVFVLNHDEKPRIVAKQLDAPTQGGLGVDGQFVGIIEDDAFEQIVVITLDIGFRKQFEFVADELDARAVGTIDKHHIGFHAAAFAVVNAVNELADDGALSRPRRAVKYDIGDAFRQNKIVKLLFNRRHSTRMKTGVFILFWRE